jgi:hypothetical protein
LLPTVTVILRRVLDAESRNVVTSFCVEYLKLVAAARAGVDESQAARAPGNWHDKRINKVRLRVFKALNGDAVYSASCSLWQSFCQAPQAVANADADAPAAAAADNAVLDAFHPKRIAYSLLLDHAWSSLSSSIVISDDDVGSDAAAAASSSSSSAATASSSSSSSSLPSAQSSSSSAAPAPPSSTPASAPARTDFSIIWTGFVSNGHLDHATVSMLYYDAGAALAKAIRALSKTQNDNILRARAFVFSRLCVTAASVAGVPYATYTTLRMTHGNLKFCWPPFFERVLLPLARSILVFTQDQTTAQVDCVMTAFASSTDLWASIEKQCTAVFNRRFFHLVDMREFAEWPPTEQAVGKQQVLIVMRKVIDGFARCVLAERNSQAVLRRTAAAKMAEAAAAAPAKPEGERAKEQRAKKQPTN